MFVLVALLVSSFVAVVYSCLDFRKEVDRDRWGISNLQRRDSHVWNDYKEEGP
ncbi:MAG: hypothetical protein QHG99_01050 [Methanomicrobiales archaeon]|nr:hypothetical protein [Methanomicrobiales archaeon]